jgi:hypothetical protein
VRNSVTRSKSGNKAETVASSLGFTSRSPSNQNSGAVSTSDPPTLVVAEVPPWG